ncbi:MAG: chemotaxis protein CheX [Spartobacteria bacterium]|nr:chemotaxis protein CheX [Spartobacteria bacterium]
MQELQSILIQSFADVLEQFAFLFADEDTEDIEEPTDDLFYQSSISFSGPQNGTIIFAAPEGICVTIAASMLGVDEDEIDTPKAEDAFRELLNVTCGKFLEDLSGPQEIFDLTVPTFSEINYGDWEMLQKKPDYILLQVEMMPVLLHIEMPNA